MAPSSWAEELEREENAKGRPLVCQTIPGSSARPILAISTKKKKKMSGGEPARPAKPMKPAKPMTPVGDRQLLKTMDKLRKLSVEEKPAQPKRKAEVEDGSAVRERLQERWQRAQQEGLLKLTKLQIFDN